MHSNSHREEKEKECVGVHGNLFLPKLFSSSSSPGKDEFGKMVKLCLKFTAAISHQGHACIGEHHGKNEESFLFHLGKIAKSTANRDGKT